MNEARRNRLGRSGEKLAATHLRALGFATLARNVRTRGGEIDLIAFDGRTLVFAEVKTRCVSARQRSIRADQDPLRGLGVRQRARLRRLAGPGCATSEARVHAPRRSASTRSAWCSIPTASSVDSST
jgi:putative endonuclease